MGKSGLVLYLGFSFGFICYLAVRSDEETGHGVSSSLFLVGMGMVSVVLGILYLSKMGHSGEGKIYVENNRHRHRYSKVERDWTISDSKMIRMPKTRRDLRNQHLNPQQGQSNRSNKPFHQTLITSPQPFISYTPFEQYHLDDIKWADQQLLEESLTFMDFKDIIPKIRRVIMKIYHNYDQEQNRIFINLRNIAKTIFGFQKQCTFKQRNTLFNELVRTVKQYKKIGSSLSNNLMKKQRLSEERFQELFGDLVGNLDGLQYQRFLESEQKLDKLQLILDHLRTNILHSNQPKLVIAPRYLPFSPALVQNQHQLVYFINPQDFCFVSKHQTNHGYNLQQTIFLLIIRSLDYKKNPSILEMFLRSA